MRVMLIEPPIGSKYSDLYSLFEPLGLEYLGAALKEDKHEVVLHDARLDPGYEASFRSLRPEVVGLTGFTSHLNIIKNIAAALKKIDPRVFIVVGGHHATVRPEDFNCKDIDLVVRGEGVSALREIIKCLEEGSTFEKIPGLGIPGMHMRLTEPRPHPSLDALPFPDRSLTEKYRQHYFSEWLKPLASIRTSLGCYSRCSFCALWALTEGKYLQRQPERIVEEMKTIKEENVFFCDDESMCDWKRMDRLADLIKEAGIKKKYYLYARVDTIIKHPDLFVKWKDIGMVQIFVGFETFSNDRLKDLNKGITIEEQEKAAQILRDLNIDVYGSFMVEPSFTKDDFKALAAYIRKIKPTRAGLVILTPLPATELYNNKIDHLTTHKPELYDLLHAVLPTTLPLKDFYMEYYRLLYKSITPIQYIRFILKYPKGTRLSKMWDYYKISKEIKQGYLMH